MGNVHFYLVDEEHEKLAKAAGMTPFKTQQKFLEFVSKEYVNKVLAGEIDFELEVEEDVLEE